MTCNVVMSPQNHHYGWEKGEICKCTGLSPKADPSVYVGQLMLSNHKYVGYTHFWQAQDLHFYHKNQIVATTKKSLNLPPIPNDFLLKYIRYNGEIYTAEFNPIEISHEPTQLP